MGDQMAPEAWGTAVGAVLTGLTGVIVAWSGLRRTRNTQLREDLDLCEVEQQRIRGRLLAALGHIARLEELLAGHRVAIPVRPPSLEREPIEQPRSDWRPRHAAA